MPTNQVRPEKQQEDRIRLKNLLQLELSRIHRLPLAFETLVVVANRFHVKPLLPLFMGNGRFYVLAFSLIDKS